MNPGQQLLSWIGGYIEDEVSLAELQMWLAAHAQELALQDEATSELEAAAWVLISEWQAGHRDELEIRTELREIVRQVSGIATKREFAVLPSVFASVSGANATRVTYVCDPFRVAAEPIGPQWAPVVPQT